MMMASTLWWGDHYHRRYLLMITVEFETDNPILQTAREAVPEMSITIENEQSPGPDDDGNIHLLFWASGGDYEAFERALDDDPTVTDPRVIADTGHSRLYRVIFTDEGMAQTAHPVWVRLDGTLLHSESTDNGWFVRMRFPERSALIAFQSWFDDHDLPFIVTGVYEADEIPETGLGPKLTDIQRETLIAAYENGYFSVPRENSLVELADELGVSDSATSQRLRRGLAKLVEYDLIQG